MRYRSKNVIFLPFVYSKLWLALKKQKRFIEYSLAPEFETIKNNHDESLNDNDFEKISNYYALGVPAILGTLFGMLRGTPQNEKERKILTYLGALTGLFDDFFDNNKLLDNDIRLLIDDPYTSTPNNDSKKLFLQFYRKALSGASESDRLKMALHNVYLAQVESKKQFITEIDYKSILDITLNKGGESLLFYRTAFSNKLDDRERELLFVMGGLMQLGNDIFDVYKDTGSGIRTAANTTPIINTVRILFTDLLDKTRKLALQTNYPKKNVSAFIRLLSLGVSRCYVCLDQLETLEKKSGNEFIPLNYKRDELICDMEKIGNILKSIKYFVSTAT